MGSAGAISGSGLGALLGADDNTAWARKRMGASFHCASLWAPAIVCRLFALFTFAHRSQRPIHLDALLEERKNWCEKEREREKKLERRQTNSASLQAASAERPAGASPRACSAEQFAYARTKWRAQKGPTGGQGELRASIVKSCYFVAARQRRRGSNNNQQPTTTSALSRAPTTTTTTC